MKILFTLIITTTLFILASCNSDQDHNKHKEGIQTQQSLQLRIGISKAKGSKGYLQYGKWLHKLDSNILYFDLYHMPLDSALQIIQSCDGLLVSGGPDVNPARYNQAYDTVLCETIDYYRDSLEYALIDYALSKKMPILGICRGEQILNVYLGGSLFPDIPTAKPNNVGHRYSHIDSSLHDITVLDSSLLFNISHENLGVVNSSHHQAVDRLAEKLVILARCNDGIVEAITWKNPSNKSFLLGVQWHPEWLPFESPFSGKIGYRFIKEVQAFQSYKNK